MRGVEREQKALPSRESFFKILSFKSMLLGRYQINDYLSRGFEHKDSTGL